MKVFKKRPWGLFWLFLFLGVLLTFIVPVEIRNKEDSCSLEVDAVVVEVSAKSEKSLMYAPLYEFELDGETVTRTQSVFSDSHPNPGDTVKLWLNPYDTSEFYEHGTHDFMIHIFRVSGGICLVLSVLMLIIIFIHKFI